MNIKYLKEKYLLKKVKLTTDKMLKKGSLAINHNDEYIKAGIFDMPVGTVAK
jgi:hypothetical protein